MKSTLAVLALVIVAPLSAIADGTTCCPPALPHEHLKIISAAACALAPMSFWGPASYGTTPLGNGNSIGNDTAANPPAGEINLYCDARLPAETTEFDYAELEYFAPDEPGNEGPTLAAYLDAEGQNINGSYFYSQTVSLGSCRGELTPLYTGTNPLSTCSTAQGQQYALDGGAFPGFWPLQDWVLFSIHFLILLPSSPDPTQPNLAYRIIVHYEAP